MSNVDPSRVPEGFTSRMIPHDGNPQIDSYADVEALKEARRRLEAEGKVVTDDNSGKSGGHRSNESGDKPIEQMSDGEKYWYEEAMKLREEVGELQPLAKFRSLIEYMAMNEDAANLIVNHMNGITADRGSVGGDIESELYDDEEQVSPSRGVNNNQPPQTNLDSAAEASRRHMYNRVRELMAEQGVPAHEADKHIKIMMNPGAITEQEMLEMYKTLSNVRGQPVGSTPDNSNREPSGNNQESAREIVPDTNGLPPRSVVGVGGDNAGNLDRPLTSSPQSNRRANANDI